MSRYDDYPDHPLCGMPDEVLAAAREVLAGAAECRDVEPSLADPIADAVVMALLPWLETSRSVPPTPEPCPGECNDGWIITNPEWPLGDLPYRDRCPYVGDSDFSHAHPTFESLR